MAQAVSDVAKKNPVDDVKEVDVAEMRDTLL